MTPDSSGHDSMPLLGDVMNVLVEKRQPSCCVLFWEKGDSCDFGWSTKLWVELSQSQHLALKESCQMNISFLMFIQQLAVRTSLFWFPCDSCQNISLETPMRKPFGGSHDVFFLEEHGWLLAWRVFCANCALSVLSFAAVLVLRLGSNPGATSAMGRVFEASAVRFSSSGGFILRNPPVLCCI